MTPTPGPLSGNQFFVLGLYRDLLQRSGIGDEGVNGWAAQLDAGTLSRTDVVWGVFNSAEHRGLQVDGFYQTYLGRQADAAGRAGWVDYLQHGGTEEQVTALFLGGAEYQAKFADDRAFVNSLYNVLLNRPAGPFLGAGQTLQTLDPDGMTWTVGLYACAPGARAGPVLR